MRRRINDVRRRVEKNKYKFVSTYIEGFHSKVYKEAEELYHTIRQNNPNTKDLTKTVDFLLKMTPSKPLPRYYKIKRNNPQGNLPKDNNRVMQLDIPQENLPKDNKRVMQLNIPLMEKTAASQVIPITTAPEIAAPEIAAPEQEEKTHLNIPDWAEIAAPEQEEEETHLDIPDRVYTEMLEEIRKDPDLSKVFNDINTQDYDPESDAIPDYFVVDDDISPLEIELAQLGYE